MRQVAHIQEVDESCTPHGRSHARAHGTDCGGLSSRASCTPNACQGADRGAVFAAHRARLFAIAKRMLGNRDDAEDALQDAYLRWHEVPGREIHSPAGFLITITTRLCLDRLRQLKRERDQYADSCLLESIADEGSPSPEAQREMAGEVSAAILTLLERLGVDERTAFLLREVFDYDYAEVAQTVGKSEAACRQLVHRAHSRVRQARPRFAVSAGTCKRVLEKFFVATRTGDRRAVTALLSEDVECMPESCSRAFPALKVQQRPQRVDSLHRRAPRLN